MKKKMMPLEHRLKETFYANVDPRRRQELHDSQMIHEDYRAMANLPEQSIHREYNQHRFNQNPMFDDEVIG